MQIIKNCDANCATYRLTTRKKKLETKENKKN